MSALQAVQKHHFTQDWFSQHAPLWEHVCGQFLPRRDAFLELGSYEGLASCWMLENLLSKHGNLYCVDTFEGSPEFDKLPEESRTGVYDRFMHNTELSRGAEQTVHVLKKTTVSGIAKLIYLFEKEAFDLIYVDAGHMATETMTDACMAWPLLKKGGLMIFDDYLWGLGEPIHARPKAAVDSFTTLFFDELEIICSGVQMIIRKKETL